MTHPAHLPAGALTAPWPIRRGELGRTLAVLAQEPVVAQDVAPLEPEFAGRVAVLPLHGVILQHPGQFLEDSAAFSYTEVFSAAFDAVVADPSVDAVVIEVHSPGGTAYGVQELSDRIFAARGRKPIIAVANSIAASAAYWVASAADRLVVTPGGEVGSIGVWTAHEDVSRLLDAMGVTMTLISAGEHKVEGNPYEPLDDEARAELQRGVDQVYAAFAGAVARNRGVSTETVLSDFGGGRMFGATQAVEAGLADQVATLDEVIAEFVGLGSAALEGRSIEDRTFAAAQGAEVRTSSDGEGLIEGTAIRFKSLSVDLGNWRETFEAGAFDQSIREDDQVVAWQHDQTRLFGRVSAGTAGVSADASALRFWARPPDAQWARDAIASIKRGDVRQCSFRFIAEQQRWERRDGIDVRVVTKARLFECSPVTHPAYVDTSVAARSHAAWVAAGRPQQPGLAEYARRHRRRVAEAAAGEKAATRVRATIPGTDEHYRARADQRRKDLEREAATARATAVSARRKVGSPGWHRWAAALHEAAHGVVGMATGVSIRGVAIDHSRPGVGDAWRGDDFVTADYLLSGVAGEQLALDRKLLTGPHDPFRGADQDLAQARALVDGPRTDAEVQATVARARKTLDERFDLFTTIAERVFEVGELRTEQLEELYRAALLPTATSNFDEWDSYDAA